MSEIVMNEGRDAVLLVGGGSLCAAAVPLLQAAGLVPAGVIHGPHCDFAAEAGVPPLGRDADLARLRPNFSRAVVTAPHKQAAKLRRLLHDALRELGFTLVSAVHPDAHRERDVLVGAGNLIFTDASLAAGCRTGTGCVLRAVDAGLRLEKNIFVPDNVHLTHRTLPLFSAGGEREGSA